jgi:phospholipid N-methyltransferase
MLKPVKMVPGVVIVELGAGTGIFTKEIIARLPKESKLVVFENNTALARLLRDELRASVDKGRVVLIEDDAVNFPEHLNRLNIPKAHYVISGLPLANFDHKLRQKLFNAINAGMTDDGVYVQFQYLLASWSHVRKEFDAKIIGFEVRNLPPAFIYSCRKRLSKDQ